MNIQSDLIWLMLGLFLLIVEMFTGTFVLIFIAIGCFAAGAVAMLVASSLAIQIIICSAVTVIGTVGFRKTLQGKWLQSLSIVADVGKEILVDHEINSHQTAQITYQGAIWKAMNLSPEGLKKGDRVLIVGIDGNTLLIRKSN